MNNPPTGGFEIIEELAAGDSHAISKSTVVPEDVKQQFVQNADAQKDLIEHADRVRELQVDRTKRDYEAMVARKCKEVDPEKAVKTEFGSLASKLMKRFVREPIPIMGDVDDNFTDFLPMYPGTYTLIGAYSNSGKTTFATKMILDAVSHFNKAKKILLLSPETDEEDVVATILSRVLGFSLRESVKNGSIDESTVLQAAASLQDSVEIVDLAKADITNVKEFKKIVSNRLETGKYGLVILDYIQCVSVAEFGGNEREAIGQASTAMQGWARVNTDTAFVAFTQLKKATADVHDFKLRTEKNHQDLYNKADWCLEMVRGKKYETHFIVRKARNNDDMQLGARIKLGFDVKKYRYVAIDDPEFLANREQWSEKYSDIVDTAVEIEENESKGPKYQFDDM